MNFTIALLLLGSLPALAAQTLSSSDWEQLRAARQHIVTLSNGAHSAQNTALDWRIAFDSTGFTAQPADSSWTWGLELIGEAPLCTTTAANQLHRHRADGVTEWFINDERGLQQGWILSRPLADGIQLRVRGNLPAQVSAHSVSFGSALTYSGLKAWDATGRDLPVSFTATEQGFAVKYEDAGAVYPITIDPVAQNAYLKASNTNASDFFGAVLAVSGTTVVVGAPSEDSSATGVNGPGGVQFDNSAAQSGAAYVFVRGPAGWQQQAYLKASNAEAGDQFGSNVAISGDTIVIGAPYEDSDVNGAKTDNNNAIQAGAAYVFARTGTIWTEQARLKAKNAEADDNFGTSVAIDGNSILVTAPYEDSSARGVNGNATLNDAPDSGAAYIFTRNGVTWTQQAYLKASNTRSTVSYGTGNSAAISGNTAVVTCEGEDSNATGINGDQTNTLANGSGAAYVYVRSGVTWTQQAYVKASNPGNDDNFGHSVALSADTLVVGATGEDSNATGVNGNQADNTLSGAGAAYVFVRNGTTWAQQAYLKASSPDMSDAFGKSVAVFGDRIAVGAWFEGSSATGINGVSNNNLALVSGAAYVFTRYGSTWEQTQYVKASNTRANAGFGRSVGLSGDLLVVGSSNESSNAVGVNGDQVNTTAPGAGAAYLFGLGESIATLSRTSSPAAGTSDLTFSASGIATIGGDGQVMFDTTLTGSGAPKGKNKAIFSSLSGSIDLALQLGDNVSSLLGLPTGARISNVFNPQRNRATGDGIFQATVSGTGITVANNAMIFTDDGLGVSAIARTGLPVTALGNLAPSAYLDVLERPDGNRISLSYRLGGAALNADTGVLGINHTGAVTDSALREGNTLMAGGFVGQIVHCAEGEGTSAAIAKWIPAVGQPAVDSLYLNNVRQPVAQGALAGGVMNGEKWGIFTGCTTKDVTNLVFRATLTGASVGTNEGTWAADGTLLLRKGDDIGGGLLVSRILRIWTTNQGLMAQVILSGPGITAANNQALILRQSAFNHLILARTGSVCPGTSSSTKIASFSAIDVNPQSGHYALLVTLSGTAANANQALLTGDTALGNSGSLSYRRVPQLLLRKGDRYTSQKAVSDTIVSIALKPVVDATGVGGRGRGQTINELGQIVVTLTGNDKAQELVHITP